MKLLHINQDFPFQRTHPALLAAVGSLTAWDPTVYVPVAKEVAGERFDPTAEPYEVVISRDYHQVDRFRQRRKSKKILGAMQQRFPTPEFDLLHAHTLVAAGAVALQWKRSNGTPYVVTVRSTDLSTFLARPRLFGKLAAEVAEAASAIVCLNPSHAQQIQERLAPFTSAELADKLHVVPNGLDAFWLTEPEANGSPSRSSPLAPPDGRSLLYVGEFTQNKNLDRLFQALNELAADGTEFRLRIVGDGPESAAVRDLCDKASFPTSLHGWTSDRRELRDHYRRSSLFAMPSLVETFGLVYLEALSQGLPILYSNGQGVDGFFPDSVAAGVDASDVRSIKQGLSHIATLAADQPQVADRCRDAAEQFAWPKLAARLVSIYDEAAATINSIS